MSKDYTYQSLIELDKLKKNSKKFVSTVRLILKDFMFKNLLSEPSVFSRRPPKNDEIEKYEVHIALIKKIRHSIINYLYSGSFELCVNSTEGYQYSKKALVIIKKQKINNIRTLTPESFFGPIETSWNHVIKNYNDYLGKLKERMSKSDSKISKIIVYEAPHIMTKKLKM